MLSHHKKPNNIGDQDSDADGKGREGWCSFEKSSVQLKFQFTSSPYMCGGQGAVPKQHKCRLQLHEVGIYTKKSTAYLLVCEQEFGGEEKRILATIDL